MKKQDFKVLKTKDLYPFPDNPFHVAEDETLSELAESIKEFGIVTPIITRPKEDGDGYEVIAGQRRVRASELAGINTVPAFVLPLDRDLGWRHRKSPGRTERLASSRNTSRSRKPTLPA